jgi:tryptophanyl-tRNA synthetase
MVQEHIILTGDRPTGPLHLGHYVGSLEQRIIWQKKAKQYVMIADVQALTDNYEHPDRVKKNVIEVALDYLAVGIDPQITTIFIQSMIPQIAELAIFYLNLVTINRLKRNPTVKLEIQQKGFQEHLTAGFLTYPIHQAADITIMQANLVPVGEDQLPLLEQANEIVRSFNRIYNTNVLREIEWIKSTTPRLVGLDGKAKMSKSLGNAIFLKDSPDDVAHKVMQMYTDPNHIRVSDPGKVEGNVVFMYLDIFDTHKNEVQELKDRYTQGGLGDVVLKKRLIEVLNTLLDPIRVKRQEFAKDPQYVMDILLHGSQKAKLVAEQTMYAVKQAMSLNYQID